MNDLNTEIFNIHGHTSFVKAAIEVYNFQKETNKVYREYISRMFRNKSVKSIEDIPYLPISFFKTHKVVCDEFEAEQIFTSSGTTDATPSRHYVRSISSYQRSFKKNFKDAYGEPKQYCILGLLPSYLERDGSSLIFMVDDLIKASGHHLSGFYLRDFKSLNETLKELEENKQTTLLFGVTYALLDFFEHYPNELNYCKIIETGGMKGRKKEMTKEEVHTSLKKNSGLKNIHSEYGMTELMSQAYSKEDSIYHCPPWMKVSSRKTTDPLANEEFGITGGINIIDLANIDSCAFIATQDLGKVYANGNFEIMGRFDNSDIRGCSQLVL